MRPRDILKNRIKALMGSRPDLDTIVKVSQKSGVSKGVVERVTKAQANLGVDHLGGLAKAFGLDVWELFADPKTAAPWPFPSINPDDYRDMDASDRKAIEQQAMHAVQRHQKTKLIFRKPTIEVETNNMQLETKKP